MILSCALAHFNSPNSLNMPFAEMFVTLSLDCRVLSWPLQGHLQCWYSPNLSAQSLTGCCSTVNIPPSWHLALHHGLHVSTCSWLFLETLLQGLSHSKSATPTLCHPSLSFLLVWFFFWMSSVSLIAIIHLDTKKVTFLLQPVPLTLSWLTPQTSVHDSSTYKWQGQNRLSSSLPTPHVWVTLHKIKIDSALRDHCLSIISTVFLSTHPCFMQILKCLSISSVKKLTSLLEDLSRACSVLCCPTQITLSDPIFWLKTQIKTRG